MAAPRYRYREGRSARLIAEASGRADPRVWMVVITRPLRSDRNAFLGLSATVGEEPVCDNLGIPNWVVTLTREEENRLRRERGWSFLAL